jgi:hypothetical protein
MSRMRWRASLARNTCIETHWQTSQAYIISCTPHPAHCFDGAIRLLMSCDITKVYGPLLSHVKSITVTPTAWLPPIHLSTYPPIYVPTYLPVYLSVCQSVNAEEVPLCPRPTGRVRRPMSPIFLSRFEFRLGSVGLGFSELS